MTTKPSLVVSQFCNLDLQNAKELKYYSSSTLPRTCTMAIYANLKCFGKEQKRTLDVERVRQRRKIGFSLVSLAMASTAFDFIDNLTRDYSMSSEATESISRTHTSKLPTFIGWQYAYLITQILGKACFCIWLQ